MRNQYLATIFFGLMTAITFNSYGEPGESIVLDPNTGDYLITYYGSDAADDNDSKILRRKIFVPATKIVPVVNSLFKIKEKDEVVYSYRITSGQKSRQNLIAMRFDPITDIVSALPLPKRQQDVDLKTIVQIDVAGVAALTSPENWTSRVVTSRAGGLRLSWSYGSLRNPTAGLPPGKSQAGFAFSSKDIPGIGTAQLNGHAPVRGFVDEGPQGEISDQLEKLTQNNYVSRNAAVPTIAVPTPFIASVLLGRIQSHVHTWIASGLLEASFSSQLDRYYQAAIDAYSHNQPKVAKEHIETLRKMLKREHEGIDRDEDEKADEKNDNKSAHSNIDRLAARVLDFDLKYVLKRMEEGKGKD
jgi:hypothetical protein